MHGAAQWACFMLMATGATLIFPDDTHRVDPDDVWAVVEREKANSMTIVGDAVLRPLLAAARQEVLRPLVLLRRRQRRRAADAGRAGHGGRAHPQSRHLGLGRLVGDRRPDARHVHGRRRGGVLPARARGRWWSTRRCPACWSRGTRATGGWRRRGNVPLGYLGDPEKTARTFPVIDGVRYSIPGDRARHRADGQIELLGRDSVTVNSGGEKIFVEEVERAIAGHPARGGRRRRRASVGALGPRSGGRGAAGRRQRHARATPWWRRPPATSPVTSCPRRWCSWSVIQRSPSGKADYRWAAETVVKAADAGAGIWG